MNLGVKIMQEVPNKNEIQNWIKQFSQNFMTFTELLESKVLYLTGQISSKMSGEKSKKKLRDF